MTVTKEQIDAVVKVWKSSAYKTETGDVISAMDETIARLRSHLSSEMEMRGLCLIEIDALKLERAELVALLTDTTVHGGSCDGIDNEDGLPPSADDRLYHDCTDVDEHQATPCWVHQVRRLLSRIGVTP